MTASETRRLPQLVIRASAGSGKTYRLTSRYLALARRGVPLERILATTFTRKAAGEILARVLTRLAAAASDDGERERLADATGGGRIGRTECLDLLRHLARHVHRLRIGTLDSLFSQMARAFSLELDLPPGWSIADDAADAALRNDAIADLLENEATGDVTRLVHLLAKGEYSQSVVELIQKQVQALYGLFQQTTHDAWRRLRPRPTLDTSELERALERLSYANVPADKRAEAARAKDLDTALRGDWPTFLSKGLAARVVSGEFTYYKKPFSDDLIAAYEPLVEHAGAVLVNRFVAQADGAHDLLARFDVHYRRLQQSRRLLRFEDVTRKLGSWTSEMTQAGAAPSRELQLLAFRLDARFDHLLLDEFQDTSLPQWQVLEPIARQVTSSDAGESARDAATAPSFFCVGDPKQAIYGWRGGLAEIFDALDRRLQNLTSDELVESRRSSPAVIDTVNRVFLHAAARLPVERGEKAMRRWCDAFGEHRTFRKELPGYVTLEAPPIPEDSEEGADEDEASPDERLSRFAAERVAELTRQAPGCSVGVLMRSNRGIARMIHLLRELGVQASEEGGNPPTDSAAVLLVASALRLADHPGDKIARFHLVQSPLGALLGLVDSRDDEAARKASLRIRRDLLDDGYGRTFERWAEALEGRTTDRDRRRVEQVIELAYRRQGQTTLRPGDFVRLLETTRMPDASLDDVRVTTIHQSKGLEYDVVVLPELGWRLCGQPDVMATGRSDPAGPIDTVVPYVSADLQPLLPDRIQRLFAAQDDADVTESLCLLYVALTRAVHALHLIVAPSSASEKKLTATAAGVLRATLTNGEPVAPGACVYAHGDPDWAAAIRERFEAARAESADSAGERADGGAAVELRLAPSDGPRRRGLDRVAPSALEGGERRRLGELLRAAPGRGRQRGSLVHAWCELVGWLDDGAPTDEQLRAAVGEAQEAAWSDAELTALMRRFRAALAAPAVEARLRRASYEAPAEGDWPAGVRKRIKAAERRRIELSRELRFAVRRDDELLAGSLDRLTLIYDGDRLLAAEVLDFKTDLLSPDDDATLQERVAYYRPQLRAYGEAVERTYDLESSRVVLRLVFLEAGRVVTL